MVMYQDPNQPLPVATDEVVLPQLQTPTIGYEQPESSVSPISDYSMTLPDFAPGPKTPGEIESQLKTETGKSNTTKTMEQMMAETGQQSQLDQMNQQPQPAPQAMQPEVQPVSQPETSQPAPQATQPTTQPITQPTQSTQPTKEVQGKLGDNVNITSRANQPYLDGRINRGTDFAAPEGTAIYLPGEGEWKVTAARNDVTARRPEDFSERQNFGWGNSVEAVNTKTGEKVRFSHMQAGSVPDLKPGEVLPAGTKIGGVGNTGNTHGKTGLHLDAEYYDAKGQRQDIANSNLANSLFTPSKQQAENMAAMTPKKEEKPGELQLDNTPLEKGQIGQFTDQILQNLGTSSAQLEPTNQNPVMDNWRRITGGM